MVTVSPNYSAIMTIHAYSSSSSKINNNKKITTHKMPQALEEIGSAIPYCTPYK